MKLRHLFQIAFIAFLAMTLQSCLKDQEGSFDEPSAIRLQKLMDTTDATLQNSEYGWAFDYYPSSTQKYGGYAYALQFKDGMVNARCEISGDKEESSTYKMTSDNGAVLSFDGYNSIIHYFSTPNNKLPSAFDGDFEFAIDSLADDLVKVRGVKTQNKLVMHKLTMPAKEYIDKVLSVKEGFVPTLMEGEINGKPVHATFKFNNRQVSFDQGTSQSEYDTHYMYTDSGISFYQPVNLNGISVQSLAYNEDTSELTGTSVDGKTRIKLQGKLPEDYCRFDDFAGSYSLIYNKGNSHIDVELVPDKVNSRYIMKGLNNKFEVILCYNKTLGTLEMTSQQVGTLNGMQVWFLAWDTNNVTPATEAGMKLKWNKDKEKPVFNFVTNDYGYFITNSFAIWQVTASGGNGGMVTDESWYINGDFGMKYLVSLIKKN